MLSTSAHSLQSSIVPSLYCLSHKTQILITRLYVSKLCSIFCALFSRGQISWDAVYDLSAFYKNSCHSRNGVFADWMPLAHKEIRPKTLTYAADMTGRTSEGIGYLAFNQEIGRVILSVTFVQESCILQGKPNDTVELKIQALAAMSKGSLRWSSLK